MFTFKISPKNSAKNSLLNIIFVVFVLASTGCATAITHKPQPVAQAHQGILDRWNHYPTVAELSQGALRQINHFKWPLRSMRITSSFGQRGSAYHQGVDLRAMPGTPVYAVDQGKVLYANHRIRGYGNMIVIKHAGEISTIYAHNSKILVHEGQRVKQGQIIARTGNTGHSRGPHLHFEIRSGLGPIDPIRYIPSSYSLARR